MQATLVLVFAAAVGLAALVTRQVRRSMRVELGEPKTVGRLVVAMPTRWQSRPAGTAADRGDVVEADEPPGGDQQVGRRLRVMRQRSDGLISPLEHLTRSGLIKADVVKMLAEGREGYALESLKVAGWPGQMVTMQASPRAGVVHKDVVACAVLPGSQAIVVQLEGLGPLDASDRELARQMSEAVSLAMQPPAGDAGGGSLELVEKIGLDVPPRYVVMPNDDPNVLQRQLVYDGSGGDGRWVGVELVSCLFFPDEKEDALAAMLAARDPEWRSGPVKKLGPRTLSVDRQDAAGGGFPARAYLAGSADGRAVLVVMKGGPGDQMLFDGAWQAIAASVQFRGANKDWATLLANGAVAAKAAGADVRVAWAGAGGNLDWFIWDASENADKELWSNWQWDVARRAGAAVEESAEVYGPPHLRGADVTVTGVRTSRPADAYGTADVRYEQQWSAAGDLSRYEVTTFRQPQQARRGGALPRPVFEQRVSVDAQRRITLASATGASVADAAAPEQFVPGAVLPLVLRQLAERPSLVRTESFVGVDTLAPPGLLTLFVTRLADAPVRLDEAGEPMECVSVSANGSGQVSRWYYSADRVLRYVDFAGGLKAQVGAGK